MSERSEQGEQGRGLARALGLALVPALVGALVPTLVSALLVGAGMAVAQPAAAQGVPLVIEDMPLAQNAAVKRGGTVTPVYEGWYPQPDGGFMLYFGYYNRNTEEVVEVPMGPANAVDGPNGGSDAGELCAADFVQDHQAASHSQETVRRSLQRS